MLWICIDSRLQREKAPLPIDVTLLGISIEVRPVQPEKALLPIVFTLFGMVTDLRLVQSQYLYIVLYQ